MVFRMSSSPPSDPLPAPRAGPSRSGSVLAWQWAHYPANHRDKRNLIIHLATVPLFHIGLVAIVLGAFVGVGFVIAGLAAMGLALGLQGLGHKREQVPPEPFLGPSDAFVRLVCEQLVTFPRFITSGAFDRAWAAARRAASNRRA